MMTAELVVLKVHVIQRVNVSWQWSDFIITWRGRPRHPRRHWFPTGKWLCNFVTWTSTSSNPWLIQDCAMTTLRDVDFSFHKIPSLLGSSPGFFLKKFPNPPHPFFIQVPMDGDNKLQTWLSRDMSTTTVTPLQQDCNLLESCYSQMSGFTAI